MPESQQISLVASGGDVFKSAVESIFFGFGKSRIEPSKPPQWGIMPTTNLVQDQCRYWLNLIDERCQGFIVVDDREGGAWQAPFKNHRFLGPYLDRIPRTKNLQELCRFLAESPRDLPIGSIRRYVEAILLQESIKGFSHGSDGDIVNGFLAPARLLLGYEPNLQADDWSIAWKKFREDILTNEHEHLQVGRELCDACVSVTRWVEASNTRPELPVADLERVMLLLTQIRTLADHSSSQDSNSPKKMPIEPIGESGGFKLLVVDDHALAWHPVFESLYTEILPKLLGKKLQINFSYDGEFIGCGTEQVLFGSYDLVLLDVFLGQKSGTDTLKTLRRDFSQLPVLLWTTSRDEEITGAARLANGILLKKTVKQKDLVQSLSEWLIRGKSLRSKTLPNPFFHHTIQSSDLRELAVDFHEWCLKQLDSFHALDGSFFRYFTDHGGRHIVKLWELLEKAIQPFLHDDDRLLPKIDEDKPETIRQREIEITALYLAVICHELGMFPMQVGKSVENFGTLSKEYLNDVRSLHALRGMVMVEDKSGSHWNDSQGKKLGGRLHDQAFGELPHRLAALVGYHARVFKSLAKEPFLDWTNKYVEGRSNKTDVEERIGNLKAPSAGLELSLNSFERSFQSVAKVIGDKGSRERLRKQCALFRFVDALDVSFTRNPPEFLAGGGNLPCAQYRENLKREVCSEAKINDGKVEVTMRVTAPDKEIVTKICSYLCTEEIGDQNTNKTAIQLVRDSQAIVSEPWKPPIGDSWTVNTLDDNSSVCLQKPLDIWLTKVWQLIVAASQSRCRWSYGTWLGRLWMEIVKGKDNAKFIKHLKMDIGILDKKSKVPLLTESGARLLASITALSAAGELLDEYRAIVEAGIEDRIRLNQDGWNWRKTEDPKWPIDGFPSLNAFLPEEPNK